MLVTGCDAIYVTMTCNVRYDKNKHVFSILSYQYTRKQLDLGKWEDVIYVYTTAIDNIQKAQYIYDLVQAHGEKSTPEQEILERGIIAQVDTLEDKHEKEKKTIVFDNTIHVVYQTALLRALETMNNLGISHVKSIMDGIRPLSNIFGTNTSIVLKLYDSYTRSSREISALEALGNSNSLDATHFNNVILLKGKYAPDHGYPVVALPMLSPIDRKTLWLRSNGFKPITAHIKKAIKDVLRGLQHIHSCGYIHLDIKESNLLLDSSNNVVIADFDLSIKATNFKVENIEQRIGTEEWMAPESKKKGMYSQMSDMYSAGLVFASWTLPAGSAIVYQNLAKTLNGDNPLFDFLKKFLSENPDRRYTAEAALHDQFLNNNQ